MTNLSSVPTPRRNDRGERTRAALIAAGRRLFCERPADAVAIDEIVQAAGVAKGSFYNHFPDREALVRAVTAEVRADVEQAVGAANAGVADPAGRVARALCVYLRYALDEPQRAGVLARVHSGHASIDLPLNRGLVEDMAAGLAAGRFAVSTLESGVLYVLGVSQMTLARVIADPSPSLAVSLGQQMCALMLRGLGVAGAEAETIAAQAADSVIRSGGAPG